MLTKNPLRTYIKKNIENSCPKMKFHIFEMDITDAQWTTINDAGEDVPNDEGVLHEFPKGPDNPTEEEIELLKIKLDSKDGNRCINVYYVPAMSSRSYGEAFAPGKTDAGEGVVVNGGAPNPSTLPHEIAHFLGDLDDNRDNGGAADQKNLMKQSSAVRSELSEAQCKKIADGKKSWESVAISPDVVITGTVAMNNPPPTVEPFSSIGGQFGVRSGASDSLSFFSGDVIMGPDSYAPHLTHLGDGFSVWTGFNGETPSHEFSFSQLGALGSLQVRNNGPNPTQVIMGIRELAHVDANGIDAFSFEFNNGNTLPPGPPIFFNDLNSDTSFGDLRDGEELGTFGDPLSVSRFTEVPILVPPGEQRDLTFQFGVGGGAFDESNYVGELDFEFFVASVEPVGPEMIEVPNVVGLPQAVAESIIVGAGLTVGTVTTENSDTVPAGDVISQDPLADTPVAPDTPVNLTVSLGPPPEPTCTLPDVVDAPPAQCENVPVNEVCEFVCDAGFEPVPPTLECQDNGEFDADPVCEAIPPPTPSTVQPGFDLFVTVPGTEIDLGSIIPGAGIVPLEGVPFLPDTDTIVERSGLSCCENLGDSGIVDIELVALSLRSIDPIDIGGSLFDLEIFAGDRFGIPQPHGEMTINRDNPDGGSFSSTLPVDAKLIFTQVGNPGNSFESEFSDVFVTDPDGTWSNIPRFDSCNTDSAGGFFPGVDPETQEKVLTIEQSLLARHIVIPCQIEPVDGDHYQGYEAKTTVGTPEFSKVTVTLEDQFEKEIYEVIKTIRFFTPVDKNGEGIVDPNTHLKGYMINGFHTPVNGIVVSNQFGELLVNTIKVERLLVPTLKDLNGDISDPLLDSSVDHFKCYEVEVLDDQRLFNRVFLEDQFVNREYVVREPKMLCNPVEKQVINADGTIEITPIQNPENHLMCYEIKNKLKTTNIRTHDQFGPETLDVKRIKELCVPSSKTLP